MPHSAIDLGALRRELTSGRSNVLLLSVPAGRALQLVDAEFGHTSVFWEAAATAGHAPASIVGVDSAALLKASGSDRFSAMIDLQAAALSGLRGEGDVCARVRFFGGSAFSSGRDGSGCWEDFGDSTFVLPRVLYIDGPEAAELLVVDPPGAPGGTDRTLAVVDWVLTRLGAPSPTSAEATNVEASRQSATEEDFEALVAQAQERIRSGQVDKVALARRETLTLASAPSPSGLLQRLRTTAAGATRFAFRIGERTFIGATPESLLRRQGLLIETEALAGTAARTALGSAAGLLASAKDQDEHRYVVAALQAALAPLCRRLDVAPEAIVKELPRLLHLCTPIVGELERPLHVLDLVARLHPTPAVCGSPTDQAFRFIIEHEAAPRGWYAAPFGWTDGAGNGHFVVGLRSALLHGNKVHLYAGAGIVRDSTPKLEYEETELKLESIRSALGLGTTAHGPSVPA